MSDESLLAVDNFEAVVARGVESLRRLQDSEGYWLGEWRSLAVLTAYGTALIACGHDERFEVLQDVCANVETYARPDGGFSHCPEADSAVQPTYQAWLLLRRCRPASPFIKRAEAFLRRAGLPPMAPSILVDRWILDPESRREVLTYVPPPKVLRSFIAKQVAPRFLGMLVTDKAFPPRAPRRIVQKALNQLGLWYSWPVPGDFDARNHPMAPPSAIPTYAAMLALQHHAGNEALGAEREALEATVVPYLERYLYEDGATYDLLFTPALLECLAALGRSDDVAKMRAAVERVSYRKGGWIRSTVVGTNVIETGLAVQALLENGVAPTDPAIQRACEFLHAARTPAGIWSWSWQRSNGPRGHRDADSDDTGSALLALHDAGSPYASERATEVIAALSAFQKKNGAITTMDPAAWCVSPDTPSNNSRALQALVRLGVSPNDPRIRSACAWLAAQQREDGSWFDFWLSGNYGMMCALEALVELGYWERGAPCVERALHLLHRTQNPDGGWGADWYSARTRTSTVEHTAMAVYTLCKFSRARARPLHAITRGVQFLISQQREDGTWPASYICNYSGWDGYTSTHYVCVFALRALAAYRSTLELHLPTVPQLVRSKRIAERRAAREGS